MYAGQLDTRITIERLQSGEDSWGQPIEGWSLIASTWASVEPLQGREYIAAMAAQAETSIRVRVRYLAGIDPTCRIVLDDGRVLNIVAVIDERNQHRFLQLMCKAAA